MFSIYNVRFEEIIAPGYSERFDKSLYVLLEPKGDITIKWGKKSKNVLEDCIVLGNNFRLENHTDSFKKVKAVVFQSNRNCYLNKPIFINKNSLKFKEFCEPLMRNLIDYSSLTEDPNLIETICMDFSSIVKNFECLTNESKATINSSRVIDKRLIYINRYIRKNYYKQLTLLDLSNLIDCHPVYLSNMYAKVFKESPLKHLQRLRMEKAKGLLINTNLIISEIALEIGYSSSSQFASYFKRYTKYSPSNYRDMIQKECDFNEEY